MFAKKWRKGHTASQMELRWEWLPRAHSLLPPHRPSVLPTPPQCFPIQGKDLDSKPEAETSSPGWKVNQPQSSLCVTNLWTKLSKLPGTTRPSNFTVGGETFYLADMNGKQGGFKSPSRRPQRDSSEKSGSLKKRGGWLNPVSQPEW